MRACVSAHTDRTWARYRKPVNRTPGVCPGKRQTPRQGERAVESAARRKWAGPDKPGPAARGGGDPPPPPPPGPITQRQRVIKITFLARAHFLVGQRHKGLHWGEKEKGGRWRVAGVGGGVPEWVEVGAPTSPHPDPHST